MSDETVIQEEPMHAGDILFRAGLLGMALLVFIRAMVEHEPFPYWSSDPFIFSPPIVGLTPRLTLLLNLAVVGSCCVSLVGLVLKKESLPIVSSMLFMLGISLIGFHGYRQFDSFLDGSNLLAIVSVLYIASFAHKASDVRRAFIALSLSFGVLLALHAVYEVFVAHPATVSSYESHRDSFLAAKGWAADSFQARSYERRLYQAEPIAWFGLTNVFASFAGAGAAGLLCLWWSSRKSSRKSVIICIAGLLSVAGLLLTQGKGGIGAFGLVLIVFGVAQTRKAIKFDGRLMILLCIGMILIVALRGILGERLGELSLLFRSQYMVGSMRLFFEHPVVGIGPGNFQDQYAMLKPALSPEDVASAHSVFFDLIAMLGVGGIALIGVMIGVLWRARQNQGSGSQSVSHDIVPQRIQYQITIGIAAIASVISIRFASGALNIDLLIVDLMGMIVWAGIALLVVQIFESNKANQQHDLGMCILVAACVLAVHAMIEVSAIWYVSGLLWALIVGISATRSSSKAATNSIGSLMPACVFVVLGGVGIIFGLRIPTVFAWENELNIAAAPAIEISRVRDDLDQLEFSANPDLLLVDASSRLSSLLDSPVPADIDKVIHALDSAEYRARALASERLIEASRIYPTHGPTLIAASEQLLWLAGRAEHLGDADESEAIWSQAIELLERGATQSSQASVYRWLGSVLVGRAKSHLEDPRRTEWLTQAQRAWEEAFARSPHSLNLAFKLMDLSDELGEVEQAKSWAIVAAVLHDESRLDPLRGLDDSDLIRVQTHINELPND